MKEEILELLNESPLSIMALCRKLNNKTTYCNCKSFQNKNKREKKISVDPYCPITQKKVKYWLNKLLYERKIIQVRCPVSDGWQNRSWDIMTVNYLHDGSILKNYGQIHITRSKRQTKIGDFLK